MSIASHSRSFVNFPEAIPGQFILFDREHPATSGVQSPRDGWSRDDVDGVRVFRSPELPLLRCRNGRGDLIGFFIGHPVDFEAASAIVDDVSLADPPEDVAAIDAWVEEQVYRFAGRYAFVLTWKGATRLYLDAAGSLPVVYDSDACLAGSTAGAIYSRDEFLKRFDGDLFDRMEILGGGWFPAALTPHQGLQRLLCNFYLDLKTRSTHRHWPIEIRQSADGPSASIRAGEEIRRGVMAYHRLGSCCMALTGGHETRLLLSTVREFRDSTEFFFLSDAAGGRDRIITARLAREFGLKLRVIPFPEVSDDEAVQWMARTGYCAGEHRYRYKAIQQLAEFDYCLGGSAGEVGRGFFWRAGDGSGPLDAQQIYTRLGLPPCPAAEQAVADWANTLPTADPLLQLDLAYLELRMSCWFAVQTYGSVGPKQAYPMISRQVFARMLEVPVDYRRGNRWILDVIRAFWPELLNVPINNLGRVRETVRLVRRAVGQPSLVVRHLKRRFG